jgi:hypothetical protein
MNIILNDIVLLVVGFAVGYAFCIWWISPDLHRLRKRVAELERQKLKRQYDFFIKTKEKDGIEIDPDA